MTAALTGSSKSVGYSCNTFACGDSISAIAAAFTWAIEVSAYQGAPSIDFSQIRASGSSISSGGTSSGVQSLFPVFDAIVGMMRRPTKKNGAGIAWLDHSHPDLEDFISCPAKFAYKGIYVPGNHEPELQSRLLANTSLVQKLATWYDEGKAFICKRPAPCPLTGEPLYLNLCTENESPSQGGCSLGVVNISQYTLETLETEFPRDFVAAALEMEKNALACRLLANDSPLWCYSAANNQFGLGVSGLASFLANAGISYEAFVNAFEDLVTTKEVETIAQLSAYIDWLDPFVPEAIGYRAAVAFIRGYNEATVALNKRVLRAFCVQPSATGAYECADVLGYVSTPELQPPTGLMKEDGTYSLAKSAFLGDEVIRFAPGVENNIRVPYEVYFRLCDSWQRLLNLTGLAHRHSASWYGKEFTPANLEAWMHSNIGSLYYRLPEYNPDALDKTQVGTGLAAEVPFDVNALLNGGDSLLTQSTSRSLLANEGCLLQQPGNSDCACAG
jgi:hypothetical protein